MSLSAHVPRPVLLALAILLAVPTLTYGVLWMKAVRWDRAGLVGFDSFRFRVHENALEIEEVSKDGPADLAGIKDGDRLVAIDGVFFTHLEVLHDEISNRPAGTVVRLEIQRPGVSDPFEIPVELGPWPPDERSSAKRIADELIGSYPLPFLLVGFAVLFLRLGDRHAWILALLFASIIASAPLAEVLGGIPQRTRGFALAYRFAFGTMGGSLFYLFLTVFPVRSPLDRRVPWLKWTLLVFQASLGLLLAVPTLIAGTSRPLFIVDYLVENRVAWLSPVFTVIAFGGYALGLVALILNTLRAPTVEVKRRTRVILWGLALGPFPFLIVQLVGIFRHVDFDDFPYWVWAPSVLFILLMPISVAYAVLKHRVLEVPVLLRRSARYFLVQRGFLVLMTVTGVVIVVVAATLLARAFAPTSSAPEAPRVTVALGAALAGVLVVWALGRIHARIAARIDRAFFRASYDARQILEDLIDRSRSARSREELLDLVQRRIGEALQPTSLVVYLRDGDHLTATAGNPTQLRVDGPLVTALASYGRPWDTADATVEELHAAADGLELSAECLVPVLDRGGRALGLLALASRRSEETYSGEDRRLLAGIAGQMGTSLESFALAEDIARRIEAERRVAHEMEIARQVQVNLLPRQSPEVRSLELAAHCVQARAVGGDFFDYLALADGHVGLVLADISGKGISAALLMSSLQATLRGRTAGIAHDPVTVMQEVNQRLIASTEAGQFATVFLGDYDDATGRLRFVNCGHNPPLLLRQAGGLEQLDATATVLGAFTEWPCESGEVSLAPGDLLVIYSDGVTEVGGEDGEMFGEARLGEIVQTHREEPIEDVVQAVLDAVTHHGNGGGAEDDLTLLVARAR